MLPFFKDRIGRYRLLKLIGSGGFAAVYKAIDPDKNIVAIKVLSKDYSKNRHMIERFSQELSILKGLSHPNIVRVLGNGRYFRSYYIVMEFVDGIDLKNRITKVGSIREKDAIEILIQVAGALGYIHSYSIVHRDVKPQNLLMVQNNVKLTDFSIALLNPAVMKRASEFGTGTPFYMSPEQIRGYTLDKRTDIYSLGITAYEMLTGIMPFPGSDFNQVKIRHLNFRPPSMREVESSISQPMDALVLKMIEKDPADRHQDAGELIADLRSLSAD